jgi:hypothetical protein
MLDRRSIDPLLRSHAISPRPLETLIFEFMIKNGFLTVVSVLLVTSLTICISAKAQGLSPEEQAFVKHAAMGGLAEVKLSQLANDRASDMKVKDFARRMITDHTQANNELKPIAESFPCLASWREKAEWHTIDWPNCQVSNLIENT